MSTRRSSPGLGKALVALVSLGVLLGLAVPRAQAAAGSGFVPGDPVAGPITVTAMADANVSPLGTLVDSTVVVSNDASVPVTVFLIGDLTFPDGSRQLLRYGPPVTIDGDGAFLVAASSLVPAGAGSGTGTFRATAILASVGQGDRGSYGGPLIGQDSDTFDLP